MAVTEDSAEKKVCFFQWVLQIITGGSFFSLDLELPFYSSRSRLKNSTPAMIRSTDW